MQTGQDKMYGASISYVDYASIESLTSALRGAHTLISVFKVIDPSAMISQHSNLLKACIAANVSRFAPSDWSMGPSSHFKVDLLVHKDMLWQVCEEISAQNGVECATFQNGMFMNYLAQGKTYSGTDRKEEEFALSGLVDDLMLEYVDIRKGKLVIPLDDVGQPSKISMTHIGDIGKFVAAAVELPPGQWKGQLGMAGDTCTLEDVLNLVRDKGIQLHHETLTTQQCDEKIRDFDQQLAKGFSIDALKGKMVAQMMKVSCEGQVDGAIIRPTLNELCPQVQPVSAREFIDRVF
ncbi:uncharacterized protein Z518_02614 [Rhinocladiella mackenziei CBS 650.93]|uniref:NmrA-like domain-containing protein n=1 Tax=Rhinocladiella mackenziei CBS 650.93 TaxID=1442369 RepID=A0A0D2JFE4_9EURO|nr:uncharacterized protein Z518_02614 [Rhinocladiella mackenziei CBS 650.93]KIX07960.1 hypothetical protein Z518_02614 [Rhinocladiella mackenziei CBS 650.93]